MNQQRILLLGSSGYLGRTLTTRLQRIAHVVPTHRTQPLFADSQHYDFWKDDAHSLIEQHQIDMVIIAANMAYEAADPSCDVALFERRAESLIRGCQRCRVIYVSSDAIFDGKKGYYAENELPAPVAPYGNNLLTLEGLTQRLCPDYCILRPSYLYGYSLSRLDTRLSQIRARLLAGERLTYFTDLIKSPMEVNQVAEAITLLACSAYVGIVHLSGPAMSVYDFYREAMSSLSIPLDGLLPALAPADFSQPKDTSLDASLMRRLTGIEPLGVYEALTQNASLL